VNCLADIAVFLTNKLEIVGIAATRQTWRLMTEPLLRENELLILRGQLQRFAVIQVETTFNRTVIARLSSKWP